MKTTRPKARQPHPGSVLHVQRAAREWALRVLYQLDVGDGVMDDVTLEAFAQQARDVEEAPLMREREWVKIRRLGEELARQVFARLEGIDAAIAGHARNWSLTRMSAVDRNVMRLAVYELSSSPDLPAAVTIDEAVEIAKTYGDTDSAPFVNGILDSIRRELAAQAAAEA